MTTPKITITTTTRYIEDQSLPEHNQYLFAYTITIKNQGNVAAKLLNRHWIITDSDNKVQEVYGEGVIGKKPHLKPDEIFTYTSSSVIATPKGYMEGFYEMITDAGKIFRASIPTFSLNIPTILN